MAGGVSYFLLASGGGLEMQILSEKIYTLTAVFYMCDMPCDNSNIGRCKQGSRYCRYVLYRVVL